MEKETVKSEWYLPSLLATIVCVNIHYIFLTGSKYQPDLYHGIHI